MDDKLTNEKNMNSKRIFISGSADGLGLMVGQRLSELGHQVVLHARNSDRAKSALNRLPAAEAVVIGDLSTIEEMHSVAEQVNVLGSFDAIIHNAAVGYREPHRIETADGLSHVFAINSLVTCTLNPYR
jgi:NAD(P)-dependent dehydrogenase (short-subunit alcohol dehydrogenase family)